MQKTIKMNGVSVYVKTGTEGPRYDPYGYVEYKCRGRNGFGQYILHLGLIEWIEHQLDNRTLKKDTQSNVQMKWELLTGIKVDDVEEVVNQPHFCECGCKKTKTMEGYPGEVFEMCTACNAIVDSIFCESAIA